MPQSFTFEEATTTQPKSFSFEDVAPKPDNASLTPGTLSPDKRYRVGVGGKVFPLPSTVGKSPDVLPSYGKATWDSASKPMIQAAPPEDELQRVIKSGTPLEKKAMGARIGADDFLSGFTSPLGIGTLGLNKVPAAGKVVGAGFGLLMAKDAAVDIPRELGDEMGKAPKDRDWMKISRLLVSEGLTAPMAGAIAADLKPNRPEVSPQIKEAIVKSAPILPQAAKAAAEVLSDVPPQETKAPTLDAIPETPPINAPTPPPAPAAVAPENSPAPQSTIEAGAQAKPVPVETPKPEPTKAQDAEEYKKIQDEMNVIASTKAKTLDEVAEKSAKQNALYPRMKAIQNRNKGFAPGTEPVEEPPLKLRVNALDFKEEKPAEAKSKEQTTLDKLGVKDYDDLDTKANAKKLTPAQVRQAKKALDTLSGNKNSSEPPASGVQSGILQSAFIPGAKEFVDQDVVPTLKFAAKHVADSMDEISKVFRAPNRSEAASRTAGIVRQNTAEFAQKDLRASAAFEDAKKMFDKAGTLFNMQFIDNMEEGRPQPSAELSKISTSLRDAFDKCVADVRALGTGKLEKLIQNYFPHLWEQLDQARSFYSIIFGKRPLEGSKSFLKPRTIPTTREGIKAGLTPVSPNPIELALLKMHEINRYVMAHKILNEMKDSSLAQFVKATDLPPDGYTKIDDRIADVYEGTTPQGSLAKRGSYYAPDDAARILNNYLSPGLRKYALFRGAMCLGNALNQAQLGLSGYHARFTVIDSATSKLALAIENASKGDLSGSAKALATSATSPAGIPGMEAFAQGSKVLKEYMKPGSTTGDFGAIVNALVKGGGRVQMDKFYKNSAIESFWKSARNGNYPGALLRAPWAALEAASKPIMEVMVPRMKLGIFADMARAEMQHNPNMSLEEQRAAFGKIWDSVDNRMGQMVYDNLFWNKTLKDAAMLATRSVGWNLGTLRELGGGVKDTATIVSRLKKGDNAMTHRMAYMVALPIMVGTLGAVYQYMHTGKGPQELQDYFMPKTGKKLPDGSDERIMLPTYMKDISPLAKAGKDFGTAGVISRGEKMAVNKSGPGLNMLIEMMQNKDFYGTQIANKDDPFMKNVSDELEFVAKSFTPITLSQYSRRVGSDAKTKYETFTGIMPATKELTSSKAMRIITDYNSRFDHTRTKEEKELYDKRKDVMAKIKAGDPQGEKDLDALVDEGKLTSRQASDIWKMATSDEDPRVTSFKRLPLAVAEEAFKSATPKEKELWQDVIDEKRAKYQQQ